MACQFLELALEVAAVGEAALAGDGTKVKTIAQKEGDASYGTVALSLAAGTYKLVVMAHNCDGSATITSTEKVTRYTGSFFGDGGGGSTGSCAQGSVLPPEGMSVAKRTAVHSKIISQKRTHATPTLRGFLLCLLA